MSEMKIAVAGLGYVGLSLAVLFARRNQVVAVDINQAKVDAINAGRSPIQDEDIQRYLDCEKLDLKAVSAGGPAYRDADFIVIATPTNYNERDGSFDTSSVEAVVQEAMSQQDAPCFVIKSTVPVGYTSKLAELYRNAAFVFSPEFLREGRALHDNLFPSRIITGYTSIEGRTTKCKAEAFAKLLALSAQDLNAVQLIMHSTEAEAVKLFSNSYLALRVAFFNELDTYACIKELDAKSVIQGVCLDPRIGNHYNNPSFGYGGYCLPKDTKQLLSNYEGVPQDIISAIVQANSTRKDFIADEILRRLQAMHIPEGKALLGVYRLTMKTGSDNFRSSSIQGIIKRLTGMGVQVLVYEPSYNGDSLFGNRVTNCINELKSCCSLIVANRWSEELSDVSDKVFTRDLFFRD